MPIPKEAPVTRIEIPIEHYQPEKRLQFLQRLFKFTFLIFRDNSEQPRCSVIRLIVALVLLVLSELLVLKNDFLFLDVYQNGYVVWAAKTSTPDHVVDGLITCIWSFQCLAAMVSNLNKFLK
jgi:hypothetical protein